MTWLVVAGLVAVIVVSYELFLRSRGYQPSVRDDEYAWAWERMRVDDSPRTAALLGSSRIMLAFSPEAFRQTLPDWQYVQLGINGTTAIGALRDLADDPAFNGVAIVDVSELAFYRSGWGSQDRYIEAYHRRWHTLGAMIERWIATKVQSRLAMSATRGINTFGRLFRSGSWPPPPYVVTYPDRTRFADYSLADVARLRKVRVDRISTWVPVMGDPHAWLADALAIEPAIAAIEARGGRVVYVRMPTCDERLQSDEIEAPKALFWDVLATRTRAVTVHFQDHPQLSKFPCPDTSHIASKDGPAFTRALLEILRARGVFTAR
jgi:hypothetical protein